MNRDVEQQVWQRVLGQSEPPRGSLRPMELEAMEAAAVYRKLAGQFSGRGREQLRHLHDMQMEILACLRGIGRLSGSGGRKTAQIAVPEEPTAKALEKRYHCARRAVTEYTVRTVDLTSVPTLLTAAKSWVPTNWLAAACITFSSKCRG